MKGTMYQGRVFRITGTSALSCSLSNRVVNNAVANFQKCNISLNFVAHCFLFHWHVFLEILTCFESLTGKGTTGIHGGISECSDQ
jgi:hypothetical protein